MKNIILLSFCVLLLSACSIQIPGSKDISNIKQIIDTNINQAKTNIYIAKDSFYNTKSGLQNLVNDSKNKIQPYINKLNKKELDKMIMDKKGESEIFIKQKAELLKAQLNDYKNSTGDGTK